MANPKVDRALQQAAAHARKGEIAAARTLYRNVLVTYPGNKQARQALARLDRPGPAAPGADAGAKKAMDKLVALYQRGRMEAVASEGRRFVGAYPNIYALWNILGAAERALGHADDACAAFRRSIELNPNFAEAHNNLGYTLESQGSLEEAVASYRRALRVRPDYATGHNNLGNALRALGNLDEAVASYKRAIKLRPDYAEALYNLGNVLAEQKKHDEALGCYTRALSIKPDFAEACHNLANSLVEKGDLRKAGTAFMRALKIRTDYAEAHRGLGRVLKDDGKLGPAVDSFERALEINPEYLDAHRDLGEVLKDIRRLDDSAASYRRALEIQPDLPEAWLGLGATQELQGNPGAAAESYRRALEIRPSFVEAHLNLGNAHKDLGNLDAATACYRRALEIRPDFAKAHRNLGTIRKYAAGDPHIDELLALHGNAEIDNDPRANICFALAKAFEDIGDPEKSLAYLKQGNALWKQHLDYDIKTDRDIFTALKDAAGPILQAAAKIETAADGVVPVFIVGMPRSGTTLTEQIISSHPEVTGAGELEFANMHGRALAMGDQEPTAENLLEFRRRYLADLGRLAKGHRYVTDKMPHNFRYVALLAAALPEARIIRTKRDAAAVCWSNFKHFFGHKGLGYCYDLGDVVEFHGLYTELMTLWTGLLGDRVYELDYEQLTQEQEAETHKLIDYVGLPWDDACLSPHKNVRSVRTASQQQVRKKVYTGSSQQWRKFEPYLGGAFDALA